MLDNIPWNHIDNMDRLSTNSNATFARLHVFRSRPIKVCKPFPDHRHIPLYVYAPIDIFQIKIFFSSFLIIIFCQILKKINNVVLLAIFLLHFLIYVHWNIKLSHFYFHELLLEKCWWMILSETYDTHFQWSNAASNVCLETAYNNDFPLI